MENGKCAVYTDPVHLKVDFQTTVKTVYKCQIYEFEWLNVVFLINSCMDLTVIREPSLSNEFSD